MESNTKMKKIGVTLSHLKAFFVINVWILSFGGIFKIKIMTKPQMRLETTVTIDV